MAEITQTDLEIAMQGPALYANRVIVNLGPVVRLSFVEQASETSATFRAAVVLPHLTAIELAAILKGMLSEIETQLKAAEGQHQTTVATSVRLDG